MMLIKSNLLWSCIADFVSSMKGNSEIPDPRRGSGVRIARYVVREIADYCKFVVRPSFVVNRTAPVGEKLTRAIFFALALLLIEAPIILLLNSLQVSNDLHQFDPVKTNKIHAIFLLILLGPIFEEFVFRAGLRSFTCCLVFVPILTLATLVKSTDAIILLFIVAIFLLVGAQRFSSIIAKKSKFCAAKIFIVNYRNCFLMNCFMFATVHVRTYEYIGWQGILAILLTAPYFLSASVMGFLRIRYGMASCIIVHSLMNAVALGAYFFSEGGN